MIILRWGIAPFILLVAGVVTAAAQVSPRVTVLVAQDAAPFRDAVDGLRRALGREVDLRVVALPANPSQMAATVRATLTAQPAVIVTLGTPATRAAIEAGGTVPLVAGMILEADEIAGVSRATGVYLQFPVSVELEWLRRVLPTAARVGVVYHSPASELRIIEARRLAPRFNLTIQAFQVAGPEQIPDALAAVASQSDVLWGMVDPLVYNPETAKSILLFSFRSMVPLVGPAPPWVQAGSLMALERDYGDIGMQVGELVQRILSGTPPQAISPVGPRVVRYLLNARTADQVRVDLSGSLKRGALQVVR